MSDKWWVMSYKWWVMSDEWWVMSDEWWVMEIEWRKLSDEKYLTKQALRIQVEKVEDHHLPSNF